MVMNFESDFGYFMGRLMEAATRIDSHYFQIPVAGVERPIFRERVYCYELYHQLRGVLGDDFPYKLDGEVDKGGHPIIRPALGAKKPDFIVHVPMQMDQNLVVIEVKPINARRRDIKGDIETLRKFLDKAEYYRAIMLIYGNIDNELPKRFQIEIDNLPRKYEQRLLFLWHREPGERPLVVKRIALNE